MARCNPVFVHDAQNGAKAERQAIARLSDLWPALSGHVALHAVFVRQPGTSSAGGVVQSVQPREGSNGTASSPQALSGAPAQSVQPRASSSGTASGLQEASVAFILSLA